MQLKSEDLLSVILGEKNVEFKMRVPLLFLCSEFKNKKTVKQKGDCQHQTK